MDVKVYSIKINGIQEAIDQAKALSEQLASIEARIEALDKKVININIEAPNAEALTSATQTRSTYVRGQRTEITSQLQTEDKLLKEIASTEEKISNARRNEYNDLLAQKDVLKEVTSEAKERAAAERLLLGNYSNTMRGLKEELKDIKTVMQTTDLSDDKFRELTTRANELTTKLKDIEASYGTFGRNVGNYAQGVADGIQKYTVQVGGITREFSTARQAVKELTNELLRMPKGAEGVEELHSALLKVKSDIADLQKSGAVMDNLLDTMQSFVAIASLSNGISSLFGFDNDKIERSIQKLVALQNILKGIETINKQLKSKEGLGFFLAPFNEGITTATKKALVYNRALLGTGTAAKTAAVGINIMGKAMKAAFSIGVVLVINLIIEAISDLIDKYKEANKVEKAEVEIQKEVNKAYATGTATITKYTAMVKNFNGTKKEEERLVKTLNSELGKSLGTYNSLSKWMDVLVEKGAKYVQMLQLQAQAQAAFNLYVKALEAEQEAREKTVGESGTWYDDFLDFLDPEGTVKRRNKARVAGIQTAKAYKEAMEEAFLNAQKEVEKFMENNGIGDYSPQIENNNEKNTKVTVDGLKELNRLRIANMKEGLNKVIKQLEEERRQKIAKIKADGVMVNELQIETNRYYDKKIEDAKREHAEEMVKIEKEMWNAIYNMSLTNYQKMAQLAEQNASIEMNVFERQTTRDIYESSIGSSTYGIQGKNTYSPKTQGKLGIVSTQNDEMTNDYKKFIDMMREVETEVNKMKKTIVEADAEIAEAEEAFRKNNGMLEKEDLEELRKYYEKRKEDAANHVWGLLQIAKDYEYKLINKYSSIEDAEKASTVMQALIEENYSKSLDNIFKQRMSSIEAYWTERRVKEKAAAEEIYKEQVDLENAEYQKRRREAYNQAEQLQKQADEAVKNGKMTEEKKNEVVEEVWKEHASKEKLLTEEHNNNLVELEQKKTDKLRAVNSEYYQDALQELRDFQTAIANLESKQPVMNAWGIINLKETKKNYNELRASYSDLIKEVQEKKKKLNEDFKNGLIDRNAYDSDIREIDRFAADLGEKLDAIETDFGDFWQGVDRWLQEIGQAFNSIYSSLATITDNYYQGEIDKQEEYIEKYEEMLDKQREATQKYADSVESIEDELSNARGARRQHLIDQLNAELAAQRASLAQEKQIEKEKEAAEKKKIELQNEQAKKKKKADEVQAYINALMAVSMAAVNQWPIPAIPLMAMATAVGAAQVAAIKSQPTPTYESGGVIQGKSHAQGGVKVLGGRAEVEGGEFITNKYTTTRNVELLEFVNSKRRKLNIEDFIEFYSSNKVRTSVKASSPKAKFAEGGMIPSLRNDIELGDRLIRAFEDYSERPSVVSVVEVLDKAQTVREVQAMAGIVN